MAILFYNYGIVLIPITVFGSLVVFYGYWKGKKHKKLYDPFLGHLLVFKPLGPNLRLWSAIWAFGAQFGPQNWAQLARKNYWKWKNPAFPDFFFTRFGSFFSHFFAILNNFWSFFFDKYGLVLIPITVFGPLVVVYVHLQGKNQKKILCPHDPPSGPTVQCTWQLAESRD